MSSIPNSAMPHAGPTPEAETETAETGGRTLSERAAGLAELARENPKTAIAAGAALAAGVVAAAIPLVRGRRGASGSETPAKKTSGGGRKKSGS